MNEVIKKVCDELKKDKQLLGIILYGSYALNENHANSDIDLIAVYEYDVDKVRCFKQFSTMIQILERSLESFKERLFKPTRKRPYSLYGKVLYDKSGDLTELIQQAKKQVIVNGPSCLSDREILEGRIALSQDIYTIEGLIANNQLEGATLLINEVFLTAIDLYYNYHHYFKVSPKRIITDLKKHDELLAEAASLVILSNDIKAKLNSLWTIRNHVLDLLGGEMLEYEMKF